MNMTNFNQFSPNFRTQKGMSTLMVAVILLVVLLVLSLFATRFQLFEQRASINQVRAAMVSSVSEAALNQGLEFMKANSRLILSDRPAAGTTPAGWLSAASPSWIPCSTAVPTGEFDPCLAEPDTDRRANMYRFVRGSATRIPLEDLFGNAQLFDDVGSFDATYNLYATLCRIDATTSPTVPTCALVPPQPGPIAVALVGRATLPGENARMTVKNIVATSRTVSNPPNVPLIAAGMISGLGSAEIVPNPNAGGYGVPLSVWANNDVEIDNGGSFATCHLGEYLTNFNSGGPVAYDGITKCETCHCSGLPPDRGLLSGKDPSTPGYEGIDIMDIDNNTNGDLPDTTFFPSEPMDSATNNFDDSPFEYTFGADVVNEGSTTVNTNCPGDGNPTGNCETQFLLDSGASVLADCSGLTTASSGLFWVQGDCSLNHQVGTPSAPVAMIVDGCLSIRGQTEFYGLMYTRGGQPGGCDDPDRAFEALGGGQIYGAIVADGGVRIRGSVQMIYNQTVLTNLGNSPAFMKFGVLPGSWSDDVCSADDGDCGE